MFQERVGHIAFALRRSASHVPKPSRKPSDGLPARSCDDGIGIRNPNALHSFQSTARYDDEMYEAGIKFTRTDAEYKDVFLAWKREDRAFFAAGACHILAHQFLSLHHGEDYQLIYIKPHEGFTGGHMYACDGLWAFDFNGWTLEAELLEVHAAAFAAAQPGWSFDRVVLVEGLPEFLKQSNDLRPPDYFPELPWKRAYNYIHSFDSTPPDSPS
jgi:hypothetical protein